MKVCWCCHVLQGTMWYCKLTLLRLQVGCIESLGCVRASPSEEGVSGMDTQLSQRRVAFILIYYVIVVQSKFDNNFSVFCCSLIVDGSWIFILFYVYLENYYFLMRCLVVRALDVSSASMPVCWVPLPKEATDGVICVDSKLTIKKQTKKKTKI